MVNFDTSGRGKFGKFGKSVKCYDFTNLPFYGFTASWVHDFTNLPFYGFTGKSVKFRDFTNLPFYGFTASGSTTLYEFTVLRFYR